jgi:hypothetical protein
VGSAVGAGGASSAALGAGAASSAALAATVALDALSTGGRDVGSELAELWSRKAAAA